jgi:hypothetical protein
MRTLGTYKDEKRESVSISPMRPKRKSSDTSQNGPYYLTELIDVH